MWARAVRCLAASAAVLMLCSAPGCRSKAPKQKSSRTFTVDTKLLTSAASDALAEYPGAAAVAMDPHSGRILAMVNPDTAVGRAFPVGSTFKPVTAVAAVQEGLARPSLTTNCKGRTVVAGEEFHCWLHRGHGSLNMHQAIAKSCNVYFYQLSRRFKGPELARWARNFGLGEKTGYAPERESRGKIPDTFTAPQNARFAVGDTPDLTATPLQMAVLAAALASGGRVFSPADEQGKPRVRRTLKADQGIRTAVRGMTECVTSPGGTCHSLSNMGHSAAGKTGTPRTQGGPGTHAWFMGFSPADNPEIAVAVFIPRGQGSEHAVPAARLIFQSYFRCKIYR